MWSKRLYGFAVLVLVLLSGPGPLQAGNLYDPASGDLHIPSLVIGSQTYNTTFTRISTSPLRWGSNSFTPVTAQARTAAVYTPADRSLWLPEVNVRGKLYNLSLKRLTEDCDFTACIEADLASVQALGREGGLVFTQALSTASTYTCSSCHAIRETDGLAADGLRRPGHPLLNAANRPLYKNGQLDELLAAVNTCVTEWMNASAWTEEDRDWINLSNWLHDQAEQEDPPPVSIDIVQPPQNLSGGDVSSGRDTFNQTCRVCHGEDGLGTELAPKITGTGLQADYIATRIRTSGLVNSPTYSGLTGGIMPFWAADRLSDSELLDVVAYVADGNADNLPGGGDIGGGSGGCSSEHPSVGQQAVLTRRFHGVSGTATIIDDCTIRLDNFSFDGGGIVVQIYLGTDGNFQPASGAFGVGGDLVGMAFSGASLTLTLPDSKSLDDFNSIAVWCVAVGISFGDGRFSAGS